jgi:serine/threonine protein kinase
MAIVLEHPHPKERLILKLYDRRFVSELREKHHVSPWTSEIEREFQRSIQDGRAADFIAKLHSHRYLSDEESLGGNDNPSDKVDLSEADNLSDNNSLNEDDDSCEDEENPRDAAQSEAYIFDYMQRLYETESKAYQMLEDLQGRDIPRLLGCVTVPWHYSQSAGSEFDGCFGILLQYIEGFALDDLALFAPKAAWKKTCEDAIRIVGLLGDRGVLNRDVRPRNFIVHKESDDNYKVVMIDFGICTLREESEAEEDWWKMKAIEDEEGAVGRVMQMRLAPDFVYYQSVQSKELSNKFLREEVCV